MKINAKIWKENKFWYFRFRPATYSFCFDERYKNKISAKFKDNKTYHFPDTMNIRKLNRIVTKYRQHLLDYDKILHDMKEFLVK
jgi:hypothetical protein